MAAPRAKSKKNKAPASRRGGGTTPQQQQRALGSSPLVLGRGVSGALAAALVAAIWVGVGRLPGEPPPLDERWCLFAAAEGFSPIIPEVKSIPASWQCPFVVRGAVNESSGWLGASAWRKLAEHGSREQAQPLVYDTSQSGVFTYWDNKSLLTGRAAAAGGVLRQSYDKVETSDRGAFLDRVLSTRGLRYGSSLRRFAPSLEADLPRIDPPHEARSKPRPAGLWVGASGTLSTPHYDSSHNLHVVIAGPKFLRLWPPQMAAALDVRPATHPEARQARRDVVLADAKNEIVLNAGDAVVVPAGWLHRFEAKTGPVAAISLTEMPREFYHFDDMVRQGRLMPFLDDDKSLRWTLDSFTAALVRFVIDIDARLGRGQVADVLTDLVRRAYSPDVRRELGIRMPAPHLAACEWPEADARVQRAAHAVADTFATNYRDSLRPMYLAPYFENVLSKVAGPAAADSPHDAIAAALDFIDGCLLDKLQAQASDHNLTSFPSHS